MKGRRIHQCHKDDCSQMTGGTLATMVRDDPILYSISNQRNLLSILGCVQDDYTLIGRNGKAFHINHILLILCREDFDLSVVSKR